MTTLIEAGIHCNSAKMASAEVITNEPSHDTVRQNVREAIRYITKSENPRPKKLTSKK
jgi:hypothetical protein